MANYIFAFHGGAMPESPEESAKLTAKWMAWMEGLGSAISHPGAPLGMSKTISASVVDDNGGSNPLSGFTLIQADNMEAAIELTKGCPILENNGSIEVAEMMDM